MKMEDTLRKIGKLQTNRVQNNIVIVTDGRDDFNLNLGGFDVGIATFDEHVTILKIPGMQFGTVFSYICINPYFGKGTIWVFSGGIHDLLIQNPLPDCLKIGCPTPPDLLSTRQCISDSSYLIQNAVQLNLNILLNTENDVALFSRLLPVRINQYNKFILMNRSCSSIHSARPINNINCIFYCHYSKTVSQYNSFIELHARTLGSSPWRLEVPIEFGKKIPLVKLLDFDGYYILWSEEIKKENRTRLLCNEWSLTSALTQVERRRAILIRGLDLRIITKEDLIDYFEEFGPIERTVIHSSGNFGFPPEFGIVVFTRDFMADIALSIGGQFRIKEVKLQATRVKNSLNVSKVPKVKRHTDSSSSSRLSELRVKSIDKEKLLVPLDELLMKSKALIQNEPKDENELQERQNRKNPMVNTDILKRKRLCVEEYKLKKFKSLQPQKDDVGSQLQGQSVAQDNSRLMIMENKTESSKNPREDSIDSKMDNCKKMNHTKAKREKELAGLKRPDNFSATSLPPKETQKNLKIYEETNNRNINKVFSPLNQKSSTLSLLPIEKLKVRTPGSYQYTSENLKQGRPLQEKMHPKLGQVKDLVANSNEIFKKLDDKEINFKCHLKEPGLKSDTNDPINAETQPVTLLHTSQNLRKPKNQTECLNSVKVKMEFTSVKQENNCGNNRESDFDNYCVSPNQELVKEEEFIDMNPENHLKDFKNSFEDHLPNTINNVKVEYFDEDFDASVEINSVTSANNYLNSDTKIELPCIKTEKNERPFAEVDLNTSGSCKMPEESIHLEYFDNALEDPIIKSEKEFLDSNTNIIDSSSAINPHSDRPDPCMQLKQKFLEEYIQEFRKLQKEFEDEFMNYKRKPELNPTYTRYRKIFFALYNTQVRKILWNQFWYTKLESIKIQEWQSRYQNFTEKFRKRIEELTVYKSEVLECMKELFL